MTTRITAALAGLVLALALAATPAAATGSWAAGGGGGGDDGGRTGAGTYAPTPVPGGAQEGEVALGSFVAPDTAAGRHGAADDYKAGVGCSIQCITGGVAYGRGPDARLVVTTDTPATIRIVVSRAGYYRQIVGEAGQTSLSADFDDLDADTHYDAFVSAVDGAGHIANRSGSFTTLQRNVQVVFNQADIHEAPYGDGDYGAQIWFEGQPGAPYPAGDADGGVLHLGVQDLQDQDTGRHLSLAVELTQIDEDVDICEAELDAPEPEVGYGNCSYSASAWLDDGSFDLDDRPSGAAVNDYWIGGTLVLPGGGALPGGYGSPLQFTVPVGVHVTFT
ncbi:hypothetical protein HC251_06155 [Iamia sp. SCSIO 61187]|uniref:hypothetical protein n=1 Tax=Iamia sp. SCSIO 61187 TaxID=2722752 RepID=UPI001C62B720|nr:hypothetical protein [Iamia sp. SCSIO 61187]QYG92062.1 hypothetical protein HC251_06155 [Iamia sp. SCSIO 61187]